MDHDLASLPERYTSLLARLRDWDPNLVVGPPLSEQEIIELPNLIKPHFGECRWRVPPSFRAFLTIAGSLSASGTNADGFEIACRIFDSEERAQINSQLVHMPSGVSRGDGHELSTNHLIGFASAGGEGVWCFGIDCQGDELPVYYHHQDEPHAKFVESGLWEDGAPKPDFPNFAAWFEAHVTDLVENNGRETAGG